MKFKSKAHMAQELIAGKRFKDNVGLVIFYDERFICPFRCSENDLLGVWSGYDEDIWTEVVESRDIHQELMDNYQEGQAWQLTIPGMNGIYTDCTFDGEWLEPSWDKRFTYRLHPHNEFIQAYRNGSKIQAYICGCWIEKYNPEWNEDTQYRIKPVTENRD
jgi:hypothetical protein